MAPRPEPAIVDPITFQIRPAAPGDALAIAQIHVDGWRRTYVGLISDELLAAQSVERRAARWHTDLDTPSAHRFTLVAVEPSGEVIGFAVGGRERSGRTDFDGELHALYVSYDHHRRGVGRLLVAAVAAGLRARGYGSMLLWVFQANPAVSFYETMGGQRVAARDEQFGDRMLPEWGYGWADLAALATANGG